MRFLEIVQTFSKFLAGNVMSYILPGPLHALRLYFVYIKPRHMVLSMYMRLFLHTYSMVQADTGGRAV